MEVSIIITKGNKGNKEYMISIRVGLILFFVYELLCIIKNWIIGQCISSVFIGLAIMVYEPLYHDLQKW